jgi:nucleoid-associated protein YgaU
VSAGGRRAAALVPPVAFVVAVVVLVAAGRGDLAAPPIDGFGAWLEARGAVTAAVALLRLAALGAAVWMLVVVSIAAVAELAGARRLAAAAERAMPPAVRRALTGLAGAGAVGAVLVGADRVPGVGAASAARAPAVLEEAPVPTVTMSLLPADEPPEVPGPPASTPAATSPVASWTVAPGDSFWSIAEEVVGDALGGPPTDAEIVNYWRRLIETNRAELVSGDPDLILPGQVFTLPPR